MDRELEVMYYSGSGGSFVYRTIYYYILQQKNTLANREQLLKVDPVLGHCHLHNMQFNHAHYDSVCEWKKNNINKKLVLVTCEPDDEEIMFEMFFEKFCLPLLDKSNRQNIKLETDPIGSWPNDPVELYKKFKNSGQSAAAWLNNVRQHVSPELIDLTISFKTIFGRSDEDYHTVITQFVNTEPSESVTEFIEKYRSINQKYFRTI